MSFWLGYVAACGAQRICVDHRIPARWKLLFSQLWLEPGKTRINYSLPSLTSLSLYLYLSLSPECIVPSQAKGASDYVAFKVNPPKNFAGKQFFTLQVNIFIYIRVSLAV